MRSPSRTVARSYGPLVVATAAFLLMALAVSPVTRRKERVSAGARGPTIAGVVATGAGVAGDAAGGGAAGAGDVGGGGQGAGAGVQPCMDRAHQVSGDPYSPPCFTFSGDNGGSTHRGVTATEIIVSGRELEGPTAGEIFAQLSGQAVISSQEAYRNTILALVEYFNKHFQFYGRKITPVAFKGQGVGASELLGGGKEAALADAVHVSDEIAAFADASAITLPYADALTQRGVVALGAPYPSRRWFVDRRPFAWSIFPDGTNVVESASSATLVRQVPGSPAEFAGPGIQGKTRVYGLVTPENQEYQESADSFRARLADGGIDIKLALKYKLDISSMPNQASNIIAQLKDAGVTSVLCGCDPVMLALGLTPKANEQDYYPEWNTAGLAFVDQDIVGQLIDQKQWSRAFGIAYNAESEPQGRSFPYAAFKEMRPNDEPAFGVEEIYYQLYMLAIGLQMAGPNLTPESFEAGMFAYPASSGPRGLWHFGEGDYTSTDDFREIWWDANRISGQNNRTGAWAQLNGGRRWTPSNPPAGEAAWFRDG